MAPFSIDTNGQLQPHLLQEWLLTNGLGGYAFSTVVGCNTRRYHGLLCAATLPPVGRVMALNRIGEILTVDGDDDRLLEFSVNQFREGFHPHGWTYLRRFTLDDVARWEYEIEGVKVVKEVQILWLQNVVGIRYTIDPGKGRRAKLRLLPFMGLRDFHAERHGSDARFDQWAGEREVRVAAGQLSAAVRADAGVFEPKPDWWHSHFYAIESDRGQDDTEDLFTPGRFILDASGPASITLWAAMEPAGPFDWDAELKRRREAVAAAYSLPENVQPAGRAPATGAEASATLQRLTRAANDFIVYRKSPDGTDGSTVIAGYPWFADWGRDTMIALPGLFLTTRRFAQARQVLGVFAKYVSEGMIPNVFDDYSNEPHYNTVDASLWFIHAAFEYLRQSKDAHTFEEMLLPACRAILDGYRGGTRYHIAMDEADGLITQGDQQTQLTWMDAKCNGVAFTPRQGKAVEINALWYHALRLMSENALADKVAESFRKAFWISPFRGLADVVEGPPGPAGYARRDLSLRPNQIFAVSLPNSPLLPDQQSAVVEVVRRELLTPMGLRTLAKSDPKYQGRYSGPQFQRDGAYHNGTVWAWPLGAFLEGYLRVNARSPKAIAQAQEWLTPLIKQMDYNCIGQIAEIYEGDPPHRMVGCPAQAWSVAEVLRLAVELGM
ncbi:MAG TPA: amylo-alpha-1,6-glucosidase [Tepidisphaeraceae bacterium]|jgi:predicted glycogen debranching enzyme|nr:amylo-alpha-1,6-glucosidase [Tepidisphaeraceae bacterium]